MRSGCIALCIASAIAAVSGQARAESISLPPAPDQVDLLLVIDRATLTGADRQRVLDALPDFMSIVDDEDGRLSLHLAVITTDMGTGTFDTCGPGDGGRFQATPRGSCNGPLGNFLVQDFDDYGAPRNNYDGDLIAALDCILPDVGQGCAYGQPVAAIQAALDGSLSENDGFLRADAPLVVLVVTGGDDCTASDPLLFDPAQADALGPLTPFRCFEHGVTCDRAIDREAGTYQSCTPREDSTLVREPRSIVEFLTDLEPTPGNVVVGLIAGPTGAGAVDVGLDGDGNPQVLPACIASDTRAIPATRLAALAGAFPQHSMVATVCELDHGEAMQELGQVVRNVLYPPPPPPPPPGPDAAPGEVTDAGGGGATNGRGGCGCSAHAGDHAGNLLLGLALFVLLSRRRRTS
jgi:MYXO-CTERM domain-containing protein